MQQKEQKEQERRAEESREEQRQGRPRTDRLREVGDRGRALDRRVDALGGRHHVGNEAPLLVVSKFGTRVMTQHSPTFFL